MIPSSFFSGIFARSLYIYWMHQPTGWRLSLNQLMGSVQEHIVRNECFAFIFDAENRASPK